MNEWDEQDKKLLTINTKAMTTLDRALNAGD